MKVLFAVSNEKISEAIIKKYQKEYKEIISYKNVYYFNAILKEIQRDKSYDRIVISEDLEPFANNDYDAIDKFLFEKLDNISDEATGGDGGDTPIILICSDRRTKSEQLLVKLFGIGIYDAILGSDRSIEQVCQLIRKPRSKKEAKIYYKIESDEVSYQIESEDSVSEVEIQNILMHYKKLDKNEEAYVDSFNNIASQYTDSQLKLIIKFLPLNVKAVLEVKSPKYQSLMTFSGMNAKQQIVNKQKQEKQEKQEKLKINFIENQMNKDKEIKQVVVPSAVDPTNVRKLSKKSQKTMKIDNFDVNEEQENIKEPEILQIEENIPQTEQEPPKRKRGRPRKVDTTPKEEIEEKPKRKRGRPRKVVVEEPTEQMKIKTTNNNEDDIDDILNPIKNNKKEMKNILPEIEDIDEPMLPGFDDKDEIQLPGFKEEIEDEMILPGFDDSEEDDDDDEAVQLQDIEDDDIEEEDNYNSQNNKYDDEMILPGMSDYEEDEEDDDEEDEIIFNSRTNVLDETNTVEGLWDETQNMAGTDLETTTEVTNINIENLITKDKKIVAFVGTSKNGTSFMVNNLAQMFSDMGINTAILDVTQNKNAYYIYTKNEEELRSVAYNCMDKLSKGFAEGIKVKQNLTVYTSLPTLQKKENYESVLKTLIGNHSLVLIDCDFETPLQYFYASQEIYLVQSMDILTIQPLTAFLRELKAKGILKQEKFKVIINKTLKVRSLDAKLITGGISCYNDPSMSVIIQLFDKEKMKYFAIPFDQNAYAKYLDGLAECKMSLNGYSKNLISDLKKLAGSVYPLLDKKYTPRKIGSK